MLVFILAPCIPVAAQRWIWKADRGCSPRSLLWHLHWGLIWMCSAGKLPLVFWRMCVSDATEPFCLGAVRQDGVWWAAWLWLAPSAAKWWLSASSPWLMISWEGRSSTKSSPWHRGARCLHRTAKRNVITSVAFPSIPSSSRLSLRGGFSLHWILTLLITSLWSHLRVKFMKLNPYFSAFLIQLSYWVLYSGWFGP